MVKILLLVCAATLPRAECTTDTARAVIDGGESVICMGMAPQAQLASTAIRLREGERLVVRCEGAASLTVEEAEKL